MMPKVRFQWMVATGTAGLEGDGRAETGPQRLGTIRGAFRQILCFVGTGNFFFTRFGIGCILDSRLRWVVAAVGVAGRSAAGRDELLA
jgi:hypothetical protein